MHWTHRDSGLGWHRRHRTTPRRRRIRTPLLRGFVLTHNSWIGPNRQYQYNEMIFVREDLEARVRRLAGVTNIRMDLDRINVWYRPGLSGPRRLERQITAMFRELARTHPHVFIGPDIGEPMLFSYSAQAPSSPN
jgi:hypothetical protein